MKEIKYKAYLHDEKVIVDVIAINLQDEFIGYYDCSDCKDGAEQFELMRSGSPNADCGLESCGLMQYTGKNDKDGAEIHDEHIIKQHRDICLIKRCVGGFECQMIGGPHKGSTFTFDYLNDKYCEIIGTSFENPEFLNTP